MKKIDKNNYIIELPPYVDKCPCDGFIDARDTNTVCICRSICPSTVMKNAESSGMFIELELRELYQCVTLKIYDEIPMISRMFRDPLPKPKDGDIIYQTWNFVPPVNPPKERVIQVSTPPSNPPKEKVTDEKTSAIKGNKLDEIKLDSVDQVNIILKQEKFVPSKEEMKEKKLN